ncbi:Gly1p [Malassezia vespertilionis]|uniref:Gly1p n=1 Tax=Malassezia vespertilionis TaxID=2020962 RepID=A0A2N1JHH8_9BASI|nr:Gly1p [Malassezia vespertilionis]
MMGRPRLDPTKPLVPPLRIPSLEEAEHAYTINGYNLISDTFTLPTPAQRTAMATAICGDAVFGSDEPTRLLEDTVAALAGKEASIFLPSGTLSNQLAVHAHISRIGGPSSILCDCRSHIYCHETGGLAYHSRCMTQAIMPKNGHHLCLEDVAAGAVLNEDQHAAPTRVVSLENTLNGTIMPQGEIVRISEWVHTHGLALHLDGARIWNVAAETSTPLDVLCAPFDTVSMCLSKGMGAPVGTVLVGRASLIRRVHTFRKLFGGGMRQTGVLANAALVSLHDIFPKLRATHELARRCAAMMQAHSIPLTVPTETNMVWIDPAAASISPAAFAERAKALTPSIHLLPSRLI